jgi:hypothetical protein
MLFGDDLVILILEGSIPGLLLLCRLEIGEVCGHPPPLPLPNFLFGWFLLGSPTPSLERPEYLQYSANASIDENLKLMYNNFGELPGFTTIK